MLDDNFEKHFKKNIESARFSWDKEDMWANIEQQLPPEKKKRVVYWYWLGTAAILFIVGFFLQDFSNYKLDAATNNSISSNNPTEQFEPTSKNKENNNQIKKTKPSSNASPLNNKENVISTITPNNDTNTTTIETATKVQMNKPNLAIKENNESITYSTNYSSIYPIVKTENIINHTIKKTEFIDDENIVNSNDLENTNEKINLEVFNIKPTNINQFYIDNQLNDNELSVEELSQIEPIKRKSNYPLSIGTYGLIGQVNRTLTATDLEAPDLLNLRNEGESTLETFGAGIFIQKYITNKLFFQGGIEYTVINERLEYTDELIEQTAVESDTAFYYQSYTGATQYKTGFVDAEEITTTDYTRYNEHHFLNMPIYFGIRIPLKRISLTAALGPVITLNQSYKGYAYQEDESVLISNPKPFISKSNLYSLDGVVEGTFNLKNNLNLFMGIHYRKGINGFSINNGIDQKYDLLTGRFGIKLNI